MKLTVTSERNFTLLDMKLQNETSAVPCARGLARERTELELQLVSFSSQALERTELKLQNETSAGEFAREHTELILCELKLQNETSADRSWNLSL